MMATRVIRTGEKSWENRHHTFVEDIDDFNELWNAESNDVLRNYNDMTDTIRAEIASMVQGTKTMRAMGGGWSWTRIATSKEGEMYYTKYLNTRFSVAPPLVNNYTGNPKDLLFVQCGAVLHELNSYLEAKGRQLKTSGASNGQTLAGALSTGTHGSAFDFGAIPEFVVGLHIIVGPDPQHSIWLERSSRPVASPVFAGKINATLVSDDEQFNAALVSFGSFGFIHGIMIETEPLTLLECYRRRVKDLPALYRLMETLDFQNNRILPYPDERPHHFQVTLNPYDMVNGAYVTTMYKRPYTSNYKPQNSASKIGLGDDVPSFIGGITDAIPAMVPFVVNKVIGNQYPLYEKEYGVRGEIFGDTELVGKLLSAAIGIPLYEVNRVRELLFEMNRSGEEHSFAGVFAFRFVKASSATLGFTHFTPGTCVLELDGVYSKRIERYYRAVWQILDKANVPYTFHWGKVGEINSTRLAAGYGDRVKRWKAARQSLMHPGTLLAFNNQQITDWSLV